MKELHNKVMCQRRCEFTSWSSSERFVLTQKKGMSKSSIELLPPRACRTACPKTNTVRDEQQNDTAKKN
jgi:hypothetical protein